MSFDSDYRPSSFEEVVGNESVVKGLQKVLEQKNKPHVFLFSGPSGCGKTTLARIVAQHLKCSQHDFVEINSANNRGIDTARDLISQMHYRPLHGEVKVYLIDEVHQTSKDFQNAMLKPFEEPPNFVYFILCTTDPDKIIAPVKTRCTQFSVELLKEEQTILLLRKICRKENIQISKNILTRIEEEAEGCPRKALLMLQSVIDLESEDDQQEAIRSIKIDEKSVLDLCRILLKGASWNKVADILKGIKDDPEKVRRAVLGYMSSVLVNSTTPNEKAAMIIECFSKNYYDTGRAGLIFSCFQVVV